MENVKLWQYVVIGGAGAVLGILAVLTVVHEERAAMLALVEEEALQAFLAGWKACKETLKPHTIPTKEIARKLLETV